MKNLLLITILLTALFSGCSKNDDPEPKDTNARELKIVASGNQYTINVTAPGKSYLTVNTTTGNNTYTLEVQSKEKISITYTSKAGTTLDYYWQGQKVLSEECPAGTTGNCGATRQLQYE